VLSLHKHIYFLLNFPKQTERSANYPVYKKKDPLDKQNNRPISILQFISKLFQKSINFQLHTHFENMFNPFTSVFRPGMAGVSVLRLPVVEDWCKALDSHEYVTAILMHLTKAFDCLPHNLLLGKLRTYGLSNKSCTSLINSYLSNRKQVKLGPYYSEWAQLAVCLYFPQPSQYLPQTDGMLQKHNSVNTM